MIEKLTLHRARDEVRDLLRSKIVAGEIEADAHIEEVKLSEQIGLSRTPVREALIALEREGLVTSRPQRGFVVIRPDVAMVRESYPVLSALEVEALKASAAKLRALAPELRKINDALKRERRKEKQYELDRAFHHALTEHCANPRLLELLAVERARAQMIDGAHKRGMANLDGSVREHASIIDAIERGDVERGARVLASHWEHGIKVVVQWLEG